MKIEIDNFNSINHLAYELVENKINFLFGISGSGKSSIANALGKPVEEKNITISREEKDTKVTINGEEHKSFGNIQLMEAYNDIKLKDIVFDDFGTMDEFVKKHIKNLGDSMNYRIALNLRMYYELRKKQRSNVYGYLSAILHRKNKKEIENYLRKKHVTEDEMINKIECDLEIENMHYKSLPENYVESFNKHEITEFENIISQREELNSKTKWQRLIKKELSSIVHLNEAYATCLNPYKFNYFSKYVFDQVFEQTK